MEPPTGLDREREGERKKNEIHKFDTHLLIMIVHHREISAAPMTQQLMVAITHFAPSPPDSGA